MSTDEKGDSSFPFCARLKGGVKNIDFGEYYVWVLYDRKTAEAYLAAQGMTLDDEFAAGDLSGLYPYYRGVGRGFGDEPYMKISPYKVLVLQRRGLDV